MIFFKEKTKMGGFVIEGGPSDRSEARAGGLGGGTHTLFSILHHHLTLVKESVAA